MFNYFRINDPFRLISLLILVIISRGVFYAIHGEISFAPNSTQYGPIGALLIDFKASLPFLLKAGLASVIILLNALLLNTALLRNGALKENTYLPAALYILISLCSQTHFYLSPELVGSAFIINSFGYLFYHLKYRGTEENIISTGFNIGLAGLFYVPYLWCVVIILVIYLVYSNTIRRRYFLMFWGFLLPIILAWTFEYFVLEKFDTFIKLWGALLSTAIVTVSPDKIGIAFAIPLFVALMGLIQNITGRGLTNHQISVQKAMVWLGIYSITIVSVYTGSQLFAAVISLPVLSYFYSFYVLEIKKVWISRLLEVLMISLIIFGIYFGY